VKSIRVVLAFLALCTAARAETVVRTVRPFDTVVLAGAARLEVNVGPPMSVTLEGDPGLLGEMVTEVHGKTLYIGREAQSSKLLGQRDRRVTVRVGLPHLAALRLNGSSRTSILGLAGENVTLAMRGSGQLHAQGALRRIELQIVGSARADLSAVAVEEAVVRVRGSGRAHLRPGRTLTATVRGTGRVIYSGEQVHVAAETSGGGKVERQ